MKKIFLVLYLFLLLLLPNPCLAATHNAASCSNSDINSAISSSSSGDTINVPEGECTWTGAVTIPSNKTIKLIGAGSDSTIVNYSNTFITSSSANSRISGFTFNLSGNSGAIDMIYIKNRGWRIDHNVFKDNGNWQTYWSNAISAGGDGSGSAPYIWPQGLIDANTFTHLKLYSFGVAVFTKDVYQWAETSRIGTGNAVYIENNQIDRGDIASVIIDANYGGSYVIRFNNISGSHILAHGLDGNPTTGTRSWEIYNNTFTFSSSTFGDIAFLRGGTGMVYNNVVIGPLSAYYITLDNERSYNNYGQGLCSGSSTWDGNQTGENGWPCRWQIGQGKDTSLFNTSSPPAISTASEPAGFWNNYKSGGGSITITMNNPAVTQVQANRDYYYSETTKPEALSAYSAYTCPHPLADQLAQGSCDFETAGTTGYTLTGGVSDTTAPTITQASVSTAGTSVTFTFDEPITATSGAAFTLDFGTAVTLTCPAVETAASSLTCTTSRTIYQSEGNSTFDYTGTKVVDTADTPNALAPISNQAIQNLSTQVENPPAVGLTISSHTGAVVTTAPSGISCGSTCSADFETGTTVTVSGYCLPNYSGFTITSGKDCDTGTGAVTMSAAKECAAYCTKIAADNKVGSGNPGHRVGAGNPAHKRY